MLFTLPRAIELVLEEENIIDLKTVDWNRVSQVVGMSDEAEYGDLNVSIHTSMLTRAPFSRNQLIFEVS